MYPLNSIKWFFQHEITKTIDFSRILWWFQTHLYKSICEFSARSSNPKISSEPKETICVQQKDARAPMHAHKIRKNIEKKAKNQLQIESEISFLDHDNNIPILRGSLNHLSDHLNTLSYHLINQIKIYTNLDNTEKYIFTYVYKN